LQHRGLAHHQVVGQQHGKGLVAHQALAAQHRVAQAQGLRLAHVDALHVVGLDAAHHLQQLLLVGLLQRHLELVGHVEVVLDRPLVATGHEDHLAHAGSVGFFHRILDQRLVDHRQAFPWAAPWWRAGNAFRGRQPGKLPF
jgi:hypothetical protein